jgi:aldehyde:ferredoxin oxidoreductase
MYVVCVLSHRFFQEFDGVLRNASHIWGKMTGETQNIIRIEARDEKVRVASIGPGGERLVRFACVLSDLRDAAGRCVMGAVMGSKNLKLLQCEEKEN